MLTENEAKTRWCPFARVQMHSGDGIIVTNREVQGQPHAYAPCLASACMAWRWHWTPEEVSEAKPGSLLASRGPSGFCGLAGAPS